MSECRRCGCVQLCTCNPEPALSERHRFIREHASRIDAAIVAASANGDRSFAEGSILPAARVWELASELWDAKPEDC